MAKTGHGICTECGAETEITVIDDVMISTATERKNILKDYIA